MTPEFIHEINILCKQRNIRLELGSVHSSKWDQSFCVHVLKQNLQIIESTNKNTEDNWLTNIDIKI
jgi:hypothetical protein